MRKKQYPTQEEVDAKFNARVLKTDSCWNWTGSKTQFGHGVFSCRGKSIGAHRYAWGMKNGHDNLIKGFHICHKCNNPSCVNPDHLYQGTPQDNRDDCCASGRQNYAKGESAGKSKLTDDAVRYIRENAVIGDNVSQARCMIKFNVSQSTIYEVLRGRLWKHVV